MQSERKKREKALKRKVILIALIFIVISIFAFMALRVNWVYTVIIFIALFMLAIDVDRSLKGNQND